MDLILVIVAVVLALVAFFILQWVAYPFVLRYQIDTINEELAIEQNINGANGANGANGNHSPDTIHGTVGQPGLSSPHGPNGNNGLPGIKGAVGPTGIRGVAGQAGVAGPQGVPGYNVIPVRQDIFNPDGKVTYYVNGVNIDEHLENKATERDAHLSSKKERLRTRIDSVLVTTADKLAFKTLLDSIDPNLVTPNVDPLVLDTYDKFESFLDDIHSTSEAEHTTYNGIVTTQSSIISTAKMEIDALRDLRRLDLAKFDLDVVKLSARVVTYDNHAGDIGGFSSDIDFTNEINDWKVTIGTTINGIILNITTRKATQNSIYTSSTTTRDQKNAAAAQLVKYNDQINLLKNLKSEYDHLIQSEKKIILDTYDAGGVPPLSISGVTFNTYETLGSGATSKTATITAAANTIAQAELNLNTNIDSAILPYRTANGI